MSSIKELFGINFNRLYEAIAVTLTKLEKEKIIIPNSACMGVKFLDNNIFYNFYYYNVSILISMTISLEVRQSG